jgi:type VI secretion system ImpA family protein
MGQLSSLHLRSFAYRLPGGESRDQGLDLDQLCAPFAGDRPCGESLLYEGTYDRIRAARSEDDSTLPQGIWETAVKVGDWKEVRSLCLTALSRDSKDIQIVLWLCEALARLHGFSGAAQGLDLLQRLCASLWPHLHPELDDGDAEARLNAFSWLNETLTLTLSRLPLALPDEAPALSFADIKAALPERVSESDLPTDNGRLVPNGLHINTAFSETPTEHLQTVYAACGEALDALAALDKALAEVLPRNEQPGFGKITTVLGEVRDKVGRQLGHRGIDLTTPPQDALSQEAEAMDDSPAATESSAPAATPATPSSGGPISSRADAYRALADAADFLARTEPHSPVPYLVRRAIRWGTMPLGDLLVELLEDGHDRTRIQELLGMGTGDER